MFSFEPRCQGACGSHNQMSIFRRRASSGWQAISDPRSYVMLLRSAAGILGYEVRELVSSDYTNDPRSSIIDAASTMVVNGTQVKIFAWYDNEWGYACRLADITRMVAGRM